ncbi:MAG: mobilization protein [Caulobacteraceae bacterium]|nr:mobilization protein [Caulobacteraceae bacterium]
MAKRTIAERLAQLEAQRKSLQTKLGKQERAKDTRRKVLLGAFLLHRLEKGHDAFSKEQLPAWIKKELPGFITRDDDAALFVDLLGEALAGPLDVSADGEPGVAAGQP